MLIQRGITKAPEPFVSFGNGKPVSESEHGREPVPRCIYPIAHQTITCRGRCLLATSRSISKA